VTVMNRPFAARRGWGRRLALFALCACLGWARASWAGPASPESVLDEATAAIQETQAGNKRGQRWEQEQAQLLEELRQARLEQAWYARQADTFQRYVDTASARVADLDKTLQELKRMETELEGDLVRAEEVLEGLVRDDLPFLAQERSDRLAFLARTVGDYDLAGAEKLRRLLEGMQAELSYSVQCEAGPGVIQAEGASRNVTLVRAGRAGLYALSPDGRRAWVWTPAQGYAPLDEKSSRAVRRAARMLSSKRILALPVLPFQEESR